MHRGTTLFRLCLAAQTSESRLHDSFRCIGRIPVQPTQPTAFGAQLGDGCMQVPRRFPPNNVSLCRASCILVPFNALHSIITDLLRFVNGKLFGNSLIQLSVNNLHVRLGTGGYGFFQ